ncbi:MAG: transglycosylase domain-containing protein [Flavobacteriales bacterium]|nr:transglycosylase domain-containing protein [Flavobacteriales bacterium]
MFFLAAVDMGFFGPLKSKKELISLQNETASRVFSSDGQLIGKFFDENRTNISYDNLPKHLVDALLATEDVRYFEHTGVDGWSLLRVFFKSILMGDRSSGGGSTITQQLAKNLLGRKKGGVFALVINKAKEAIQAGRIEEVYSKEEILTLYLNTIPFGENIYGIETASQRFFNKKVDQLRIEESAVLIGMLKANTMFNPRLNPEKSEMRRNVVLAQMMRYEFLGKDEFDSLKQISLQLDYANLAAEGPANYFIQLVKQEARTILEEINEDSEKQFDLLRDGLIIETTLNAELQNFALIAFREHLSKMQQLLRDHYGKGHYKKQLDRMAQNKMVQSGVSRNAADKFVADLFSWDENAQPDTVTFEDSIKHAMTLLHAGLLALNPQDGAIQIYVGGIDFIRQPYDQILAKRQLASTFKPVLYSLALESGYSPCDYLKNDSIVFEEHENWTPKNYDHSYGGKYSLAAALAKSKNIPTVNLYEKLGHQSLATHWRKLGFTSELPNTPAASLGTTDASLLEVAVAYSSFANGGYKVNPYTIKSIKTSDGTIIYQKSHTEREQILNQESAELMGLILRKAVKEGTGTALINKYGVSMPFAAKTGTSQNYGDAWFAAFNSKMVIATRVGASSNQIHFNTGSLGSGSKLALPLVGLTLQKIQNSSLSESVTDYNFQVNLVELEFIYDCEDYKETPVIKDIIDDLFDGFRIQRKSTNKGSAAKKRTRTNTPSKNYPSMDGSKSKKKKKKKKPRVWKKKKKHF